MNVIISNKYQALLGSLNIDVIKSLNGEFTVEELNAQFNNFFFNKMIIDITAIKDYENPSVIQELSISLDMSKVILLLDDSEVVNSPNYLSKLVSMGIYNFTRNVNSIPFLIDNPNQYKDVVKYQQLNSTFKLNETIEKNENKGFIGQRVIGFKNITEHAGATTLIYILKKHLEKYYKVIAVEVDSTDFSFFNDKGLENTSSINLASFITSNSDKEVILVDLNNNDESLCTEVIYLIEPGLIKLNKLIRKNNKIFNELKGKKIVLNRSVLDSKDVKDFEKESGSEIFYNLPALDDKMNNIQIVNDFLQSSGFTRLNENDSSILNIF